MLLGDRIEQALQQAGIDKQKVEQWVGGPCGCEERQFKLNALDAWARVTIKTTTHRAREYLHGIMGH